MKFRLKDKELQKKLDELSNGDFSKKLETEAQRKFVGVLNREIVSVYYGDFDALANRFSAIFEVDEVEWIQEYNPRAWNEWPNVEPPKNTPMRFAKLIGIQRKRLIDWLRVNRYIYGVSNTPYQNRIEQGLLVLRNPEGKTHSDGTPVFAPYAHVTPKGAGTIYRHLLDEGLIKRNDQLELNFA